MKLTNSLASLLLLSIPAALCHPGEAHHDPPPAAALAKRAHLSAARRGLDKCSSQLSYRALQARAEERRRSAVKRHAKRADLDTLVSTSHKSNRTDISPATTPEKDLFFSSGDGTCILSAEGEVGPYRVQGEHLRTNVREDQAGVPIVLDGQFINVETCEPIPELYWDLWNCNSTGVYSGLVAAGNGNADDLANYNTTYLRGLAKTDADGVVQFQSVFPGHYSGRATHHHMVAWLGANVLPNNTLTGGTAAHIGQLFWDQDLINEVEATYPYNTNTIAITENADDHVVSAEAGDGVSDPFINYVYLGDSLEDGLFGWVTIGVNVSASYDAYYSFALTPEGGKAVSYGDAGSGMPTGGMPGGASGSMSLGGPAPTDSA